MTLESTYKCISLQYYQAGIAAGSLSAALDYQGGSQQMIYINADDTNNKWFLQHIPFDTGLVKFQISATRGDTDKGLIAVDEIDILTEEDCVGMFRCWCQDQLSVNMLIKVLSVKCLLIDNGKADFAALYTFCFA